MGLQLREHCCMPYFSQLHIYSNHIGLRVLYRKNLFMREKLNKKKKNSTKRRKTQVILLEKQINSNTIAYLFMYSASNIT